MTTTQPTTRSLHEHGYEGEVEDAVPVSEYHRAECNQCDWKGELHDGMSWRDAEAEAIEHFEEQHGPDEDFDDDDEDGDDPT